MKTRILKSFFLFFVLSFYCQAESTDSANFDQSTFNILNSCKNKYENENKGFLNSLIKSNRGIFDQIISSSNDCTDLVKESITNKPIEDLKSDFANIGNFVKEKAMLETVGKMAVATSVEASLTHAALYEDESLAIKEMKKQYPTIAEKVAAKKLAKLNTEEIKNKYVAFGKAINEICAEMGKKTFAALGVEVVGGGGRGGDARSSAKFVEYKKNLSAYVKEASNKLNNKIKVFTEENRDISSLLYSESFKDILPLELDKAEKCAKGKITEIAEIDEIEDIKNTKDAIVDIKEKISDDLKMSKDAFSASRSNKNFAVTDQIDDLLKYKPYLIGNFIKNLESEEDKIFYAKYICKRTFDIYNSDELWNTGFVTGGIIVGTVVGVATGGLGVGVMASVAAGAAVGATEGAIIYSKEMKEGNKIVSGATAGVMEGKVSDIELRKTQELADDRKLNAYLAVGGAVVAPIAHIASPLLRAGKTASHFNPLIKQAEIIDSSKLSAFSAEKAAAIKEAREKIPCEISACTPEELSAKEKILSKAGIDKETQKELLTWEDVLNNARLSDQNRRLKVAKEFPELTSSQIDAVLRAHNDVPCVVTKCSVSELKKKAKILTDAGISDKKTRKELLRRGFAGDPPPVVTATNKTPKEFFADEIAEKSIPAKNASWANELSNGTSKLNANETNWLELTAQKTLPDGSSEEIKMHARVMLKSDGKFKVFTVDQEFTINPADPNLTVTNIAIERRGVVDGVDTPKLVDIFENNPKRAFSKLENNTDVTIKYADEDGEIFEITGTTALSKDRKQVIKYPNKYRPGEFLTKELDDLPNIQSIESRYAKAEWTPQENPRTVSEKFKQGANVVLNFKQIPDLYASNQEITNVSIKGNFVGVTNSDNEIIIRLEDGTIKKFPYKNVNNLSTANEGGAIIRYNGGSLPN